MGAYCRDAASLLHRRLANGICGQAMSAAIIVGVIIWAVMCFFANPLSLMTGLTGQGREFAVEYFRMLSFALPFLTVMFIANTCLRGAGDTLTPAVTFIVVDILNVVFSFGLTYGLWGMPKWGFEGIAAGTCRQAQPSLPAAATTSTFRSAHRSSARARTSCAPGATTLWPALTLMIETPRSRPKVIALARSN